jgi:ABC-type proline/glycine betaine transport system permease subunit
MALAFLLDGEPREKPFFVPAFGIAGLVCVVIAAVIGAAVILTRGKSINRAKLADVFWLFLGSGICLIVLAIVLERWTGPRTLE